eukprot:m.160930 g.160930  ORF g.160930 m.160930 type:complete len:1975 (+) comp14357_c1_seq2:244-6168(+)
MGEPTAKSAKTCVVQVGDAGVDTATQVQPVRSNSNISLVAVEAGSPAGTVTPRQHLTLPSITIQTPVTSTAPTSDTSATPNTPNGPANTSGDAQPASPRPILSPLAEDATTPVRSTTAAAADALDAAHKHPLASMTRHRHRRRTSQLHDIRDTDFAAHTDGYGTGFASDTDTDPGSTSQSQQPLRPSQSMDAAHISPKLVRDLKLRIAECGTISVFFSSPFGGMEGERTAFIERYLPILRGVCEPHGVFLKVCDLRWGITTEAADRFETLRICLQEIDDCDVFVGMYGRRYGSCYDPQDDSTQWVLESFKQAEPDYPWVMEHLDKAITDIEFRHGFLRNPKLRPSFIALRDPQWDQSMYEKTNDRSKAKYAESSPSQQKGLQGLIDDCYEMYRSPTNNTIVVHSYPNPEEGARLVFEDILCLLRRLFPKQHSTTASTVIPSSRAISGNTSFQMSRCHLFHGREKQFQHLETIFANPASSERPPLALVTGQVGAGKSALIANYIQRHTEKYPHDTILSHFVGSSTSSTSLRDILDCLLAQLSPAQAVTVVELKELYELFRTRLVEVASQVCEKHPDGRVVVVLDGLNQLDSDSFTWLPGHNVRSCLWIPLPSQGDAASQLNRWIAYPNSNVLFLLSAVEHSVESQLLHALPSEVKQKCVVRVPALEKDVRYTLVEQIMTRASKTLTKELTDQVVSNPHTGNPLFLTLLLEELIQFGRFSTLPKKVAELAQCNSTDELLDKILTRIEAAFTSVRSACTTNVIETAMCIIYHMQHGIMANTELRDLLGLKAEEHNMVWSSLFFCLKPLWVVRSGCVTFMHQYVRDAVARRYISKHTPVTVTELSQLGAALVAFPTSKATDMTVGGDSSSTTTSQCMPSALTHQYHLQLEAYFLGLNMQAIASNQLAAEALLPTLPVGLQYLYTFYKAQGILTAQPCRFEDGLTFNTRMLQELPYHAILAHDTHTAARLLQNIAFLDAKASAGFILELLEDYLLLKASASAIPKLVDSCVHLVKRVAHQVLQGNTTIQQAALNMPVTSPLYRQALDVHKQFLATQSPVPSQDASQTTLCPPQAADHIHTAVMFDWINKQSKRDPCLQTLTGHDGQVCSIDICRSRNYLVTAGIDGKLFYWDIDTQQQLKCLAGHSKRVTCCQFVFTKGHSEATAVLSGSRDRTIRLWTLDQDTAPTLVYSGKGGITSMLVAKNSALFVAGTGDKLVLVFQLSSPSTASEDAAAGNDLEWVERHRFSGHAGSVRHVSLGDGDTKCVSCDQLSIHVWCLVAGVSLLQLKPPFADFRACCLSDTCEWLAAASQKSVLRWGLKKQAETSSGLEAVEFPALALHKGEIKALCRSQDDAFMASGGEDNTMFVWDMLQWRAEVPPVCEVAGHNRPITNICLSSSGLAASASKDATARVYDMALFDFGSGPSHASFQSTSTDRQDSVQSTEASQVVVEHNARPTIDEQARQPWHSQPVLGIQPSSSYIVSVGADARIQLHEKRSLKHAYSLPGHSAWILACSVASAANVAVTASHDTTLLVFNPETQEVIGRLSGHTDAVQCCDVSPAGNNVVSGSVDKTVRLWTKQPLTSSVESEAGGWVCSWIGSSHASSVTACALHPTEPLVLSGDQTGHIHVSHSQSGKLLSVLSSDPGHNSITSMRVSACGMYLAATWGHNVNVFANFAEAHNASEPVRTAVLSKTRGPLGFRLHDSVQPSSPLDVSFGGEPSPKQSKTEPEAMPPGARYCATIAAIYANSQASKSHLIREGDAVLRVNNILVTHTTAREVQILIDSLETEAVELQLFDPTTYTPPELQPGSPTKSGDVTLSARLDDMCDDTSGTPHSLRTSARRVVMLKRWASGHREGHTQWESTGAAQWQGRHTAGASACAISAEQDLCVSVGRDGSIKLWCLTTGALYTSLIANQAALTSVSLEWTGDTLTCTQVKVQITYCDIQPLYNLHAVTGNPRTYTFLFAFASTCSYLSAVFM